MDINSLISEMKLYLESQHRKKPREPILSFLERYFKNLTKGTYFDEPCTQLQCSSGKNRSIDEMLLIVKTEYPKSKNSDIYKAFRKLLLQNKQLVLVYCCDIDKWVFTKFTVTSINTNFIWNHSNSDTKKDKKGKGKETFNSFMIDKLGFTEEELYREV